MRPSSSSSSLPVHVGPSRERRGPRGSRTATGSCTRWAACSFGCCPACSSARSAACWRFGRPRSTATSPRIAFRCWRGGPCTRGSGGGGGGGAAPDRRGGGGGKGENFGGGGFFKKKKK